MMAISQKVQRGIAVTTKTRPLTRTIRLEFIVLVLAVSAIRAPAGDVVFVSLAGENRIAVYDLNDETGQLQIEEPEQTDEVCEKCGKPMAYKHGRFGKFLGCSAYPDCKNVKSLNKPIPLGIKCPKDLGCGEGDLVQKISRRGKVFYSCDQYPKCTFASWDRPFESPCPECEAPFVVEKTTKRAGTVRRCLREECEYSESIGEDAATPEEQQP